MINKWTEVKCDYMDDSDMFWCVDAWQTNNENEEGRVIAHIDDLTARVTYDDPDARIDPLAKEIIAQKIEEIKQDWKNNKEEKLNNLKDIMRTQIGIEL